MNETGNNSPARASGSLSDRVRSLRLTESSEPAGNTWWWLPWALCVALLFLSGFLALEAFSPIDDDLLKKLAEERKLDLGTGAAPASLRLPGSPGSGESSAEISLESKGYIVPF